MNNFEMSSISRITQLKENGKNKIPTNIEGISLQAITYEDLDNEYIIEQLSEWRNASQHAFLKIFPITIEGTRKWLKCGVLERNDRILFLVVNEQNELLGHVGLSSFNFIKKTCEIDNVIKSPSCNKKGLFTSVTNFLANWAYSELQPEKIILRVFSDNSKALALYSRIGFIPTGIIPFMKIEIDDITEWIESDKNVDRCFIIMERINSND